MKHPIKVQRIAGIVGAVATLVMVGGSELQAQADTSYLALQQMLSVDKKKKQDKNLPAVPRGQSPSDYGNIGANPRRGREVSPKCEDAYALAAQIMAGGPVDRQVTGRNFGNMDASQGMPTPPFEARMAPREVWDRQPARTGRTEISKSMNSMRGFTQSRRPQGC